MSKKTVKVSMELPELPEGYEYTGEYRAVKNGEYFCRDTVSTQVYQAVGDTLAEYPIIRKREVWRSATAQDVHEALCGKTVMVRYMGRDLRLVGGAVQATSSLSDTQNLLFWLRRPDFSTFVVVAACNVQVS